MDVYAKIRTLAMADATLQSYFGNPANSTFRWFKIRLQPGYITQGPCVRVQRISTRYGYTHAPTGLMQLNEPRMDICVMDFDSVRVGNAANAVIAWMGTVNFAVTNQFDSPVTTPPNYPNFLLDRRSLEEPQVEPPGPPYVELLSFRIFNLEN